MKSIHSTTKIPTRSLRLCSRHIHMMLLCISASTLLSAACSSLDDSAPPPEPKDLAVQTSEAIYGTDNRQEVYAHPDATLRARAQTSIVALIYPDNLNTSNPSNIRPIGPTLGQSYNLCSSERFRDQTAAASCSGTLIDDDLVLTAGHCAESNADCQSKYFVFKDYYSGAGQLATITSQDVFTCQRVVVRSSDPDYAIIQLDRPATPRFTPAPVKAGDTALALNQSVGIIGFGSGIPAKIDNGGVVIDPRASVRDEFVATTDSFGGNSGSGVFDSTGQVVGILVAGATDYTPTSNGCWVAATYPNSGSGGGETVTYVQNAIEHLCASGWSSTRLCGGGSTTDAWCQDCGSTACPTGWSCFNWSGSSVTFCSKPCTTNADCRSDHTCDSDGDCIPTRANVCNAGDVWSQDSCGRNITVQTDCTASQTCQSGACINTCAGSCTVGARQCVSGGFQTCNASPSGGCPAWSTTQACSTGQTCTGAGLCTDTTTEAYCRTCDTTPCPNPWSCFQWTGTTSTFCAKPCATNADCRSDHECLDTGSGLFCAPSVDGVCQSGDVYAQDSCGNSLGLDQDCTASQSCSNGQCVNQCSNQCTNGARRCVTGGFQTCSIGAQGCTTWSTTQACPTGDICTGAGTCTAPDAWCDSCNGNSDCPTGWNCFLWNNTNVSFCSKPCASDTDCDATYRCDAAGDCIPRRQDGCYSGDVWDMDACGNPVYAVTDCSATQTCQGAACVTGCTNQCVTGARRCTTSGGFQTCAVGAQGCAAWGTAQSCGAGQVCTGAGTCTGAQDAWCQACATRTDCPTGWGCYAWQGSPGTGWCSKPCASDSDCRADHTCDTGVCLPQQSDACYEGDVWTVDACDNPISLQQACTDAQACAGGVCESACVDACVVNTVQCSPSGDVDACAIQANGCTAWQPSATCGDGTVCADGVCAACDGVCTAGERRCAGSTAAEVCAADAQGCTAWEIAQCEANQRCDGAGVCSAAEDTSVVSDVATSSGTDTSATSDDVGTEPDGVTVADGDVQEERVTASGAVDDCSCQVRATPARSGLAGNLYGWSSLLGVGLAWMVARRRRTHKART